MYTFNKQNIEFINAINLTPITITDVRDFQEFLHENHNFEGFLFRGLSRSSYNLKPSIERELNIEESQLRINIYESVLNNFKQALRGRIDLSFDIWDDDFELWALGQHYGLNTPLLDWTASPWIALFFAFENERTINLKISSDINLKIEEELKNMEEARSIILLNTKLLFRRHFEALSNKKTDEGSDLVYPHNPFLLNELRQFYNDVNFKGGRAIRLRSANRYSDQSYSFPIIFSPRSGINMRLVNQRGMFTCTHYNSFETSITKCLNKGSLNSTDPLLIKIDFPNLKRNPIISHLYEMNISRLSLFPDVFGAAQYVNWKCNRYCDKNNLLLQNEKNI